MEGKLVGVEMRGRWTVGWLGDVGRGDCDVRADEERRWVGSGGEGR